MSDHLPPLAAIRVFEAAARHLSFTRAAQELGMTQAAVSYQIKLLEERVGSPLFLRRPREVVLTEAGERLGPEVSRAFDILRSAFVDFGEREHGTLIVNTMHTFAAQWLAPRLGIFQLRHPEIAVRLETTDRMVDFGREQVDVVVRAGKGNWPGLNAVKLIDVRFTPMLSPALAATIGGVREPADILKLPLLDSDDPWWIRWLDAYGLPHDVLKQQTTPSMNMQTFDAIAAMAGQGVTLLTPEYFQRELAEGRLIQPFERVIDVGTNYWLAYPEGRRNVAKIKAFRDWVVEEANKPIG
ncbi:MAG TPA: transcriptional regulator GcvA [Devosia sp.]|jgi:LysR family glycine cleavage system transcriptional activator|uniref:transcriptional regulator GcvA n=1 Tax=Devosia sp. TaxID=1871048 RepID=UPI002DDD2117|nr:transcriptional regulator GcvA [Devosia sp.]HEV2514222.1 transcriptional regulator GcvA [Devosia sp.]